MESITLSFIIVRLFVQSKFLKCYFILHITIGDLGQLRTYYVSLLVNNNLDKNIDIRIRLHNGTEQTRLVPGKSTMVTDFLIQSKYQPDDIGVYGVLPGTTDIVYLNGKPELIIQPTVARNTFTIDTEGDSGMIDMVIFATF